MNKNIIYYIIGGGLLYFIYNKFKNKSPEALPVPVPVTETKLTTLPVSKPKGSKPTKKIETVTLPFSVGNTIVPVLPYQTLNIYDPTFTKILAKSYEAKFIKPVGSANNVLKVEATYLSGNYKIPTKIIGYTQAKYWRLK
jgi:hypothetical protein